MITAILASFKNCSDGLFFHLSGYNIIKSIRASSCCCDLQKQRHCKQILVLSKCLTYSLMDLCGILYKGKRKEREELRGEKRRGIIPDTLRSPTLQRNLAGHCSL